DGGATPKTIATAQGIYADALFAGTLWLTNEMNIESNDGYLNVTGSRFTMRSKNNTNNAVVITPDGITIHGWDGRELVVDGIMRGQQVANIQLFNDKNYVEFNGRDMEVRLDESHPVYVLWDRYKGRYLDLSGIARLDSTSCHDWSWVDIRITRGG